VAAAASGAGRTYRTATDRRFGIQVENADQIRKALISVGVGLGNINQAHEAAGKLVKAKARQLVPVSNRSNVKSGRLKQSIRTTVSKTGAELRFGWDGAAKSHGAVVYAGVIEYGDPKRNRRPQPFGRMSVITQRRQIRYEYLRFTASQWYKEGFRLD
jgi:hypothetical protein